MDTILSTEAAENALPTPDTTPTEKYADPSAVIINSTTPSWKDASALKASTSSTEFVDNAQPTPSSTEFWENASLFAESTKYTVHP